MIAIKPIFAPNIDFLLSIVTMIVINHISR